MIDTLLLDLRYALRALRRSPGFTALAVTTLGLGIGAATAGFSLLNRILLQPVPGVRDPATVGFVTFHQQEGNRNYGVALSNADRGLIERAAPAVAATAGFQGPFQHSAAAPGAAPVIAHGTFVTGEYLHLLGVEAVRGRLIDSTDDPSPSGTRVAVISDRLWQLLYGGRPDVIGAPLIVNGVSFSVVGVTSPGFRGPDRIELGDFWLPGNTYWDVEHFHSSHLPREITYGYLLVRLRPGASFELATAQLQGAMRTLVISDTSRFTSSLTANVISGAGVERGKQVMQHQLALIMGVAGLVLLVACANIANLLLFRRVQRKSDIVVRTSLGASTGRLMRLFLTESGLLGVLGSVGGLGVAFVLREAFGTIRFFSFVDLGPIPFDVRVLAFAVAAGVAASLLAGIVPAVLATRVDLVSDLKASGPTQAGGAPRLRVTLAALQVSVSLALVSGAYLFADTLRNYERLPLGFNPAGVSIFHLDPERMGYDSRREQTYYQSLTERVAALPGVSRIGLVDLPPFSGVSRGLRVLSATAPVGTAPVEVDGITVSGTYFGTLGIPIVRGRAFVDADLWPDSLDQVGRVILSAGLAKRLFGVADPIGSLVLIPLYQSTLRAEVVGVAADMRSDLIRPVALTLYQPVGQGRAMYSPAVAVRSTLTDATLTKEFEEAARTVDGSMPVDPRGTLTDAEARSIASQHLLFRVISLLTTLTLLLTAVGVYGIVAYGVTTRTREFGIRTALGAVPANLIQVALRPALIITVGGTLAGVGGALYLTRFIAASLYGVSRFDPLAFVSAALVLAVAVLLASWLPARRAARIDPMVALRYE